LTFNPMNVDKIESKISYVCTKRNFDKNKIYNQLHVFTLSIKENKRWLKKLKPQRRMLNH